MKRLEPRRGGILIETTRTPLKLQAPAGRHDAPTELCTFSGPVIYKYFASTRLIVLSLRTNLSHAQRDGNALVTTAKGAGALRPLWSLDVFQANSNESTGLAHRNKRFVRQKDGNVNEASVSLQAGNESLRLVATIAAYFAAIVGLCGRSPMPTIKRNLRV